MCPPLPKGEGWGEGEGDSIFFEISLEQLPSIWQLNKSDEALRPNQFMKTTLLLLLSGLFLGGCAQKQASSASSAIELVQAGEKTVWQDGTVLQVTKCEGASLQGIQIARTSPDGHKITLTADNGTISSGSIDNPADANAVKLTLHDAHIETLGPDGKQTMKAEEATFVLNK
jgi:hypothetical protein